jgi:hypothetical protein
MRLRWIFLDYVPQARYADIDTTVIRFAAMPAQAVHDVISRQHSIGVPDEHIQKIELGPREANFNRPAIQRAPLRLEAI